MGLFKDAKGAMGGAAAQQAAAEAMVAQMSAGVAEGSYDPNDPGFEPIDGIDLDRYAALCKAVSTAGVNDEAETDKWAVGQGLQPGQWQRVNAAWTKRMEDNRMVMNRFGMLFAQS